MMGAFSSDLRHAFRRWRARPAFAATAVLTLTLGIGVTTAIFSIVDGVLLRPLPWPESDRLVSAWIVRPHWYQNPVLAPSADRGVLSWPNFRDLQQHSKTIASVAIWSGTRPTLDGPVPEQVWATRVSSTFLETLKTWPIAGRNFSASENDDPSDSVIISYEAWQHRFGGEPEILGKRVRLDEVSKVIVGVLPPRFRFEGQPPEFLLPVGQANKSDRHRGNHNFRAVLRLKRGVTIEQAQADTEPVLRESEDPTRRTSRLEPLAEQQLGAARRPLLILLGAAVLLLLVACANVAGLLLGDVRSRRHELAVRTALGAGRFRLGRQLLAESLAIAVTAAAAGLLVAWWTIPALVSFAPERLPRLDAVTIDLRVFGFALLLCAATTFLCGAAAAMTIIAGNPAAALSEGGRGGTRRQRAQGLIVVAEIALSMVLLVGATLFAETVRRMNAQPLGFNAGNLIVIGFRAPRSASAGLSADAIAARVTEIEARLAGIPGVISAAGVSSPPFSGGYGSNTIEIEGKHLAPSPSARRQIITESFFKTMGIPVIRGRVFQQSDSSAAKHAVVSREFERRYMDGDAIGKRFKLNQDWHEIIGVVANTKQLELTDEDEAGFYALRRQLPGWSVNQFVVRASGDSVALIAALREAVRAYDSRFLVTSVETMDTLVKRSIADERYRALLSIVFGVTALLLAAVGVYGLLARDVADRRREIGLRMALGAKPSDVVQLVGRRGLGLASAGLMIGLPASFGTGRLVESMLFGVRPAAPEVFAIGVAALLAAALAATLIPARRASRIDPIVSLRGD